MIPHASCMFKRPDSIAIGNNVGGMPSATLRSLSDYGGEPMKKQTILVGLITAAFILVGAGTSFAGDRRSHRPVNHWKGKHFTSQKHAGHWKRGHQVRHPRTYWNGHRQAPRYRWNHRGVHPRSGYRAHQNPARRGWGPQPSFRHGPGQYGHRPQAPRHSNRHSASPSFDRQRGDRGHAADQAAMRQRGGRGDRDSATTVASEDSRSRRGNRDGSRRQ
jgi:hypothetical protein